MIRFVAGGLYSVFLGFRYAPPSARHTEVIFMRGRCRDCCSEGQSEPAHGVQKKVQL